MKLIQTTIAIATLLMLSFSAGATVVWDEIADGDVGIFPTAGGNLGTLSAGNWDVINGSLDGGAAGSSNSTGNGPDEFDDYFFTATDSWTVDLTFLNLISTSSLLTVQLLGDGNIPAGYSFSHDSASTSNVFGASIAAGSWGLRLLPAGNAGELEYEFSVIVGGDSNSVPAPGMALILLLGMILVGLRKRV